MLCVGSVPRAVCRQQRTLALVWKILLYHSKHTRISFSCLLVLFSMNAALNLSQISMENKIEEISLSASLSKN